MTNGIVTTNDWEEYEYGISITICNNGKMLELNPSQIQGIMIEKDFDGANLPVLTISISKQESANVDIDNKAEFIVSIDRFVVVRNSQGNIKKRKNKSNILRGTFSGITTDTTSSGNTLKSVHQKEANVKENEITQVDFSSQSSYPLFKKEDLISSKHIFNNVLSNVSMTETIAVLLSQAGVSKVLMTNLDNTERIQELLLMPIGLIEQLKYLKNYYGWHKEDTMIFMDFDVMYLIRMNGKCTAWRSGEIKEITFYIDSVTNGDNICGGMATKGSGLYVNVGSDNYVGEDETSVVEQTTGTNLMLVDENSASISTVQGTVTNTLSNSGSTAIKTTTGHNKYLNNWVKARSTEQSGIINLTCNNVDFSQFTPNKQYTITSGKTKIAKDVKGTYRISKMTTSFAKDGNYFMSKTNVTLKKSIE